MLCRIGGQIGIWIACQRPAAAAAALVEQYRVVTGRVEEAPLTGRTARAGTAVKEKRGPAVGIAAALPIDAVPVADVERPTVVRFDRRKLIRHQRDSLSLPNNYRSRIE